MQSVSDSFKAAVDASTRQWTTRVTCWFLDNALLAGFVTATAGESEDIFGVEHLVNGRNACQRTWALARDDCYPADDLYPPDDAWETGWMSDETSDASGNVSPAEEIVVEYTTAQRVSEVRWWADSWIGYPVDFALYYWDSDASAWTLIESVTGNSATSYASTLAAAVTTLKIKMEISKISRSNDHPALVELQGGLVADLSAYVTRWECTHERFYEQQGSIPLGNYAAGELALEMDNTDFRFFPENASGPYYGYLRLNRRIVVEAGLLVSGAYEYCDVGTFYVSKWPSASDEALVNARTLDRAKLLQAQMYESAVLESYTASEIAAVLAAEAGLDQAEINIDDTTYEIPYAVMERKSIWEHLRQLAIGEGGCVYFREDGALVFENRDHLAAITSEVATLDDYSNIVRLQHEVDEGRIRNLVRVRSKRLRAASSATIWSLQETITVPGSGEWWDAQYLRRRQLTVTAGAGAGDAVTTSHTLKIEITGADAAAIYALCQSDAGDLRVLYVSGGYIELDRYVEEFSTTRILIYVKAQAAIGSGASDTCYWLYYYNTAAGAPPDDLTVVFAIADEFERAAVGSDWEVHDDPTGLWNIGGGHLLMNGVSAASPYAYWDHLQTAQSCELGVRCLLDGDMPMQGSYPTILENTTKADVTYGCEAKKHWNAGTGAYDKESRIITPTGTTLDTEAGTSFSLATWHRHRLQRLGTNWYQFLDGVLVQSRLADAFAPTYFGLRAEMYESYGSHVTFHFDDFWVRFTPDTEPVVTLDDPETKPAIVSGSNTSTIQVQFQGPAINVQAPVIVTAGPDISVQSYAYTAIGGTVVLQNTGPEETISGLTIDGQLLESDGELVATAQDELSIAEFGERGYELENDYIQDLAQAQTMADALLAAYLNPSRQIVIDMPARGMPHLELADRVHVENDRTGVDADYWIVRSRLTFDGALDGELTCIEAS